MYGFRVQNRMQTHGAFRLLLNAFFSGGAQRDRVGGLGLRRSEASSQVYTLVNQILEARR